MNRDLSLYHLQVMSNCVPIGNIPYSKEPALEAELARKFELEIESYDYSDYEYPLENGYVMEKETGRCLTRFRTEGDSIVFHSVNEMRPVFEVVVKYQYTVDDYVS